VRRHRALAFGLFVAAVAQLTHCGGILRIPEPVAEHMPRLRVMTFNVNFGVSTDPHNLAAVRDADADVVLLQETTDETEAVFRRELADAYPHMRFRECCRAGGLAILSRHPIVEDEWIPSEVGWFPAWRFVVDGPLGEVQLLDVHLRPPVSDSGSWIGGYLSTGPFREDEITTFFGQMRDDIPTIVAGDFNENERGDALGWLAERGFTSVLPEYVDHAMTWHWNLPFTTIRARLDHIVYGPGLRPHAAEVIEAGRSDHFPVVASFTLE